MNAPREHRPVDTATRNRNRWMLVALFALFFGGMALAGLLRFSGWRPEGLKNKGELLDPPADLRAMSLALADGGEYRWRDAERTWRILAVTDRCDGGNAVACTRLLTDLDKVWQLAGKDADRVHVLWVGALPPQGPRPATLRVVRPTDALRDALPRAHDPKGMPVYLLDPNGFVVLRYAPGSDPGDLRTDLSRLLKVN
jgi:cytochrome oxidase Cu insertion factor (SCO1/SenC/PrrC family)